MVDAATTVAPAGLLRRLAALLYDLFPAVALAFVASFAMLPLSGGEAIVDSTPGAVGFVYHAFWPLVVFAYFGWSWTRSGQTLGLRAWNMRLERGAGGFIGWPVAVARYLLGLALFWLACVGAWNLQRAATPLAIAGAVSLIAPLALNFAWIAVDRRRRTLVDIACGTRVSRVG